MGCPHFSWSGVTVLQVARTGEEGPVLGGWAWGRDLFRKDQMNQNSNYPKGHIHLSFWLFSLVLATDHLSSCLGTPRNQSANVNCS